MKQFLSYLLSTTPLVGIGALLFLFLICFLIVHIAKLSLLGYRQYKTPPEPPRPVKPPAPNPPQEKRAKPKALPAPIYYLVEKKRVRKKPKSQYEEPKRINFED